MGHLSCCWTIGEIQSAGTPWFLSWYFYSRVVMDRSIYPRKTTDSRMQLRTTTAGTSLDTRRALTELEQPEFIMSGSRMAGFRPYSTPLTVADITPLFSMKVELLLVSQSLSMNL